jgi:hypothetical protein
MYLKTPKTTPETKSTNKKIHVYDQFKTSHKTLTKNFSKNTNQPWKSSLTSLPYTNQLS